MHLEILKSTKHPHVLYSLQPWQPSFSFLSLWTGCSECFSEGGSQNLSLSFPLAYFPQHNVLEMYPCCSMYQYHLPFKDWIIFLYIGIPYLVYSALPGMLDTGLPPLAVSSSPCLSGDSWKCFNFRISGYKEWCVVTDCHLGKSGIVFSYVFNCTWHGKLLLWVLTCFDTS